MKTATELAQRGIYVWDGHYYAIELMERLGLLDTGGAVRIGFCHYHSADEVDRVLGGAGRPGLRPRRGNPEARHRYNPSDSPTVGRDPLCAS